MKKEILMLAAAAMVSMGATACGTDHKEGDDTLEQKEAATLAEDDALDAAGETEVAGGVSLPEGESPIDAAQTTAGVDTIGYTTTGSGLKYKVVKEGEGKQPAGPTAIVKVHYAGKHLDGTTFDSSYDRGEPIEFPLNRVIPGWTEGVQLMKEGAKYQFIIPSNLAYGQMGTPGGPIKPNEDLYFEVELLQVL